MRVDDFLAMDAEVLVHRLAYDDARRFRRNEAQQLRAWAGTLSCLRAALAGWAAAAGWEVLLEFPMRRLGRRIDAVLVTPRGVLVLEFKIGAARHDAADRRQVEDYALDLQDFHAGSRAHPIVPILVATAAPAMPVMWPLLLAGVSAVLPVGADNLGAVLRDLWTRLPVPASALDVEGWAAAPYRPVPAIVEAACALYGRHGVAEIAAARADTTNLSTTTEAILAAVARARMSGEKTVLFVTGIPGAGKTLCGLNAVFGGGRATSATFLTGNPTLVHVLREALARDAAGDSRGALRAARQRTKSAIQALPAFRDLYVANGQAPPEQVVVIDEAQRAWSAAHAIRKGRDREVALSDSEPGHLLDIMARRADFAVVVCLVGNGQEIHDGEGGLAEWGAALAARPEWRVISAPGALTAAGRQRLPEVAGLRTEAALHLDVPVRSVRSPGAAAWVDAVLAGDAVAASAIAAAGETAFLLTRDLAASRGWLRAAARGWRRCGLVGSSGAKRLRAEGLGVELAHMDAGAVAHWFLDRWPGDVRSSEALEVMASEFSCQGLELDVVGLCWGGDVVRAGGGWRVRDFVGTAWQIGRARERVENRMNTYRVLLTRARYETVIWVPRGDAGDSTRSPEEMDAVATFLLACGITALTPLAPLPVAEGEMLLI
jgi:hypothetical protein